MSKPCTCPDCGGELFITCPKACPNAELGATSSARPFVPERKAPPVRKGTATERIIQAVTQSAAPMGVNEVAAAANVTRESCSAFLTQLVARGLIARIGVTRPYTYTAVRS